MFHVKHCCRTASRWVPSKFQILASIHRIRAKGHRGSIRNPTGQLVWMTLRITPFYEKPTNDLRVFVPRKHIHIMFHVKHCCRTASRWVPSKFQILASIYRIRAKGHWEFCQKSDRTTGLDDPRNNPILWKTNKWLKSICAPEIHSHNVSRETLL